MMGAITSQVRIVHAEPRRGARTQAWVKPPNLLAWLRRAAADPLATRNCASLTPHREPTGSPQISPFCTPQLSRCPTVAARSRVMSSYNLKRRDGVSGQPSAPPGLAVLRVPQQSADGVPVKGRRWRSPRWKYSAGMPSTPVSCSAWHSSQLPARCTEQIR